MKYKARYSIGEVSRICNISKKTLRYYDEIGLISTQRKDYNNYRFYTYDSLLAVPIIKYYKQMGFKLEEMREFIEGDVPNVYRTIQKSFMTKIDELAKAQEDINRKFVSVKAWNELLLEAEQVIDHNINEVSVRYVEPMELLYFDQTYDNHIKATIINIDFTNYLETIENAISGPVILNFPSYKKRIKDEKNQKIKILQKPLLPCSPELTIKIGGQIMLTCYHIGPLETISETYEIICRWASRHDYSLGEESFERYVTDYWTTKNSSKFVTEIMLTVNKKET